VKIVGKTDKLIAEYLKVYRWFKDFPEWVSKHD